MNDNPVAVSCWHNPALKYMPYFLASAKRYGINVHNADDSDWGGLDWRVIEWWRKTIAQIKFVREHPEYSHFMFTDSHDIIFAAGWDEIMLKYHAYQSPIVFGTESYPWPKPEQAEQYPPWPGRCRFLNAGFWMADAASALLLLTAMEERALQKIQCDQGFTVDLFLSGKFPIKLDNACKLLYCMNNNAPTFLRQWGDRLMFDETKELPCVFHGNGASPLDIVIKRLGL